MFCYLGQKQFKNKEERLKKGGDAEKERKKTIIHCLLYNTVMNNSKI